MTKPISKSKRQLAQLLIEAGVTQFPKGANWAAQDKVNEGGYDRFVGFYEGDDAPKCTMMSTRMWRCYSRKCKYMVGRSVQLPTLIPNWHQTVLSRDEFDQIVAETVVQDTDGWVEWHGKPESPVDKGTLVDMKMRNGTYHEAQLLDDACWSDTWGGESIIAYRLHKPEQAEPQYCESVIRSIPEPTTTPTLDQLLQDWRNADDYAQRKQTEADEAAAMRDERWQAVQARAGEMGVTVGRCEPVVIESELVITDYHHLHIGDILRCKSVPAGAKCRIGDEGVLVRTENAPLAGGVYVDVCGRDWFGVFGEHWEFIRRP